MRRRRAMPMARACLVPFVLAIGGELRANVGRGLADRNIDGLDCLANVVCIERLGVGHGIQEHLGAHIVDQAVA